MSDELDADEIAELRKAPMLVHTYDARRLVRLLLAAQPAAEPVPIRSSLLDEGQEWVNRATVVFERAAQPAGQVPDEDLPGYREPFTGPIGARGDPSLAIIDRQPPAPSRGVDAAATIDRLRHQQVLPPHRRGYDLALDDVLAAAATPTPAPGLERLRRIETAARRLDRAYGPRSIGMVWTVTQEMVDAWRELQEAIESAEGSAGG